MPVGGVSSVSRSGVDVPCCPGDAAEEAEPGDGGGADEATMGDSLDAVRRRGKSKKTRGKANKKTSDQRKAAARKAGAGHVSADEA